MAIKKTVGEHGIWTYECDTWKDFFEEVCFGMGQYDQTFMWRGQRNASWRVDSSFVRAGKKHDSGMHLRFFKAAIQGFGQPDYDLAKSPEDRLRLWALGRHFGLKTPLIDFSQFPFVALFFAFEKSGKETKDQEDHRAVFALDWHSVRILNTPLSNIPLPTKNDQFKMVPAHSSDNLRVQRQGGIHMYLPEHIECIEDWCCASVKESPPSGVLRKYIIPNKDRFSVIRSLNKMNLNHASLFPDLGGAAMYCNSALEEGFGSMSSVRAF